jgi:hypothetical protein
MWYATFNVFGIQESWNYHARFDLVTASSNDQTAYDAITFINS